MTVRSTGGNANTLAVPGDYWYPRDEFVQLQLSGGSIPGEEIERVTFDAALKTLTVKLKDQGDVPTTMDIALTEWRLESPTGVAVSEVEHVKIVYQDGSTNEIARADGLAGIDAVPRRHIQKWRWSYKACSFRKTKVFLFESSGK